MNVIISCISLVTGWDDCCLGVDGLADGPEWISSGSTIVVFDVDPSLVLAVPVCPRANSTYDSCFLALLVGCLRVASELAFCSMLPKDRFTEPIALIPPCDGNRGPELFHSQLHNVRFVSVGGQHITTRV